MDATTQKIINKLKRLCPTGTDSDELIAQKIGDALDQVNNDIAGLYAFVDEVNYEITPSIAETNKSSYRQAIYLKTRYNYIEKKKDDAAAKAVRVKSGRDEVDTTKAMAGYEKTLAEIDAEYLRVINKINGQGTNSVVIPDVTSSSGYGTIISGTGYGT